MERLTIDFCGNWVPKALCSVGADGLVNDCDGCRDYCTDDCDRCGIQHSFDLLASYEDTGLLPGEIMALKKDYEKSTCTGCWLKNEKRAAKKITELKELLESAVEELENVYQRETELTERIREVI